ncbi:TolC family protein [Aquimarina sp. M1]
MLTLKSYINVVSIFLILLVYFSNSVTAQENIYKYLSLEEAIELSKSNSLEYKTAKNSSDVGLWTYKSFQSNFYPEINVSGILPSYNKTISRITSDDGTDLFVSQNQAFSSLSVDISQRVYLTGGTFSISSSVNRIDIFSDENLTTYSTNPFSISYFQESIFYNPLKWEKKIQPLVYEESKRDLIENIEGIALNTTSRFFDFLEAEKKYQNALQNAKSQDTIYKISKGRFKIGKLYENDLLQSELGLLNAEKEVINAKNQLKLTKESFLELIGDKTTNIKLIIPKEVHFIAIDSSKLFDKALENTVLIIRNKRKVLEAKNEVAKTKRDGIKIGLNGNFGLTNQNNRLGTAYTNLLDQQTFTLNFSAPIFSWGKRNSQKKIALANLELIKSTNAQELNAAKRELSVKYMAWQQLEISLRVSKKALEISKRRYSVSKRRFAIGKVSITDLNIAQKEKDSANSNYYRALREYWELFYEIRKLTLYDFSRGRNVEL